jgi:RNA polymerase sigma-70 factor, ECF subfamily
MYVQIHSPRSGVSQSGDLDDDMEAAALSPGPAWPCAHPTAGVGPFVNDALDDAALMTAIAERADRAAFARLFQRYAPKVKAQLVARGAASGAADELTQEVMLVVWRKAALYDASRGSLAAWLYTVGRNCLYNRARGGKRREVEIEAEGPEPGGGPASGEELMIAFERQKALALSLRKLSAEQREILEGAYWRGQTLQECAEERKIPLGTVKTRVRLALQHLRELMKTRSDE